MTDQMKKGTGVALLGLVLLLLGALSGRDESAGAAMFGAGLLLLLVSLVAIAVGLIRGEPKPRRSRD